MNKWYIGTGLLIALVVAAALYSFSQRETVSTLTEQLTTQLEINKTLHEQYNEQLRVNKDVVTKIVVVKAPDGTTTTTTEIADKTKVSKDVTDKKDVSEVVKETANQTKTQSESTTVSQSKYSVFVSYPATTVQDLSLLRAGAAVRLGGLPLFFQVDSDVSMEVRGGFRFDW
jgi:hypothetical protein